MCKVYEFNEPCPNIIGNKVKFPFTENVPHLGKEFMYSYDGIVYECISVESDNIVGQIVRFEFIDFDS